MMYVTTSWDDGHICDLRLADLLKKYAIKGTFYVAPHNREQKPADLLTSVQVIELAKSFEIGAHTLSHPFLTQVSDEAAEHELVGSKKYLEELLQQPVTSFCYPGGFYSPQHVAYVRQAGFSFARTVKRFTYDLNQEPLTAPTTFHAYRHWSDAWRIAKISRFNPWRYLMYQLQWDQLAIALFERAKASGGLFHLWGHSWEIDKNHDWQRLEKVLAHIANQSGVQYITNGEISHVKRP